MKIDTFGTCDPDLWDALRRMICDDRRCVRYVQEAGIPPANTLYYDAVLSFLRGLPKATKETIREHWFRQALRATADADLVCVDPDNGIRDGSKKLDLDGPKYTYISDLQAFWDRGQSLAVYQQQGRADASDLVAQVAATLRDDLSGAESIAVRFNKGTSRMFFVLPQPTHRERIEERIARMLDGPWSHHFERAGE